MQLRRLTVRGMKESIRLLASIRAGDQDACNLPEEFLFGPRFSEPFEPTTNFEPSELRTRRDAAGILAHALDPVRRTVSDDGAAWSWLGMCLLGDFQKGRASTAPLSPLDEVFVMVAGSRAEQRRYRHYLWGAWRLYQQHGEKAAFLLDEPLDSWTDLAQRAFGATRIFNSEGVIPLMLRLYTRGSKRKRGYSKGVGGLRHLIVVLEQLARTYDVYGMSEDALLKILPQPFERWADSTRNSGQETDKTNLDALRQLRKAVVAANEARIDLRQFMHPASAVWKAYVDEHGVPGYQTRIRTVLERLDSMISNLRNAH